MHDDDFAAILFALPVLFAVAVLVELAFKKSRILGALSVASAGLLAWIAWLHFIPFIAISMAASLIILAGIIVFGAMNR